MTLARSTHAGGGEVSQANSVSGKRYRPDTGGRAGPFGDGVMPESL